MNQKTSAKSVSSVDEKKRWVLALAGGLIAGIGLFVYLRYGDTIAYNLRLLNAKRIADKFYAEYDGISKSIPYGSRAAQKLDVYRPETGSNYPVLIFVHGGGWDSGNKELYAPVAQKLLPEGLVLVVPGYTLYPDATYRQQTDDVAAAISWTLENIAQYGGDPKRIIAGGQSAGGHLTALAVLDAQWLSRYGHTSAELCGYYGIAGVYDIAAQKADDALKGDTDPIMTAVMEGDSNFANASPLNFVRPDLPPVLLIHGDADETVDIGISRAFHEKLQSAGAQSQFLVYPGAGHSGLLFDALASNPARLVTDLSEFAHNCPPVK